MDQTGTSAALTAAHSYNKWSNEEREYIINTSYLVKDKVLLEEINSLFNTNRKLDALRKFRQRIGIKKKSGRGKCQLK